MQGCMWGKSIHANQRLVFLWQKCRWCPRTVQRTPGKRLLEKSSSHHLCHSTDAPRDKHQCRAFSFTMIKTDFSKPLLLPSLESSIQMQIALNPINPFRHLCESVSASVCARVFRCIYTHTQFSRCAHLLSTLSFREEEQKIVKDENVYFQATLSDARACIL